MAIPLCAMADESTQPVLGLPCVAQPTCVVPRLPAALSPTPHSLHRMWLGFAWTECTTPAVWGMFASPTPVAICRSGCGLQLPLEPAHHALEVCTATRIGQTPGQLDAGRRAHTPYCGASPCGDSHPFVGTAHARTRLQPRGTTGQIPGTQQVPASCTATHSPYTSTK